MDLYFNDKKVKDWDIQSYQMGNNLMTTEIEKQFFDTFEIEPRKVKICRNINHCPKKYKLCNDDCKHWEVVRTDYPQITDRQYLELICVSNKELIKRFDVSGSDLESIKKNILSQCMKDYTFYSNTLCETYNRLAENFKHQVQAIFEGKQ